MRRSVEALADAEKDGRERDHEECRGGDEPVAARVDDQPGDRPEQRHQDECTHPPAPLDPARERELDQHDRDRVDEEDCADLPLAQLRLVTREGREKGEQRVPGGDEEEVQRPEPEKRLVSKDGPVRRGRLSNLVRRDARIVDEREHDDVGEERECVEHEQDRERRRFADDRDPACREAAEADPEVHRDPLLGEGCVATGRRRQARDERRLAGPKAGAPGTLDRNEHEGLPRLPNERQESVADRLEDQPGGERRLRADAVDERPGDHPAQEQRERRDGHDEPCRPEREAADVVQVDDEERQREPVSERVREPADLEQPHRERQARVQAAEVAPRHRHGQIHTSKPG